MGGWVVSGWVTVSLVACVASLLPQACKQRCCRHQPVLPHCLALQGGTLTHLPPRAVLLLTLPRSPTPTSSSKPCRCWTGARTWAWCCRPRWAGAPAGLIAAKLGPASWGNPPFTAKLACDIKCTAAVSANAHPLTPSLLPAPPPTWPAGLLQPQPQRRHLQPRQRPLLGLHTGKLHCRRFGMMCGQPT